MIFHLIYVVIVILNTRLCEHLKEERLKRYLHKISLNGQHVVLIPLVKQHSLSLLLSLLLDM